MPWSAGTECVAKYNFQTANDQDLPFCKGDVLTIVGVTRVRVDKSCPDNEALSRRGQSPPKHTVLKEVMVPEPAHTLRIHTFKAERHSSHHFHATEPITNQVLLGLPTSETSQEVSKLSKKEVKEKERNHTGLGLADGSFKEPKCVQKDWIAVIFLTPHVHCVSPFKGTHAVSPCRD